MASYTLPRPILRLPFKNYYTRPFSSTIPRPLPEPQSTHPSPSLSLPFPNHHPDPTIASPPAPSPPPNSRAPASSLQSLIGGLTQASQYFTNRRSALAETEASYRASDLERHLYRRFRPGDIYAPHDLSPTEQQKWRFRTSSGGNISGRGNPANTHTQNRKDVFDVLGIHPLNEYKNFSMMTEFMTSMGRIRHRRDTGLRGVNQRKMAKAVRRAVGMGLLPSVHKHPEMLEREAEEMARKRAIRRSGPERGGFGGRPSGR
ncbi:MAG: hypothetical protein Q9172_001385 [Xanthocarpia lactea]